MTISQNRLEYQDINVSFGATKALTNVSFSVQPGEILGLLGHNGAGKSTLFNITSGVNNASSGSVLVDGQEIGTNLTPRKAAEHGITVIHQEPALVPNLSVLDNLFLAREIKRSTNKREEARDALTRVGADVPLDMPVDSLSLGERQLLGLARGVLAGDMKILLLDEPTAALGKAETNFLHALIKDFAAQGVAVIYVSHRLPDIMEACTRIVVLRAGKVVMDDPTEKFTPEILADALAPNLRQAGTIETSPGDEVFTYNVLGRQIGVRSGEVVGIFGMAGGEQFKIAAQLSGAADSTEYQFLDKKIRLSNPRQAIRRGIFYVPPDRDKEGLIATETAKDNVMFPWYGGKRSWWISQTTGRTIYEQARHKLDIQGPTGSAEVAQFSGGNRQKHLLSRWIYPAKPKLLFLSQPTQGVDVGAKLDIVEAVRTVAQEGAAVVVVSSESDEIASMCDRSYVISQSQVSSLTKTEEFNSDLLSELLSISQRERSESIAAPKEVNKET